jgi:Rps23 Pro-64 3,4-dihydroxylase Tpa1-like proline 4-hydroxylase
VSHRARPTKTGRSPTGASSGATTARFAFSREHLEEVGRSLRAKYLAARPFPHVVVDGLVPNDLLDRVVEEFPAPSDHWRHFDDDNQRKYGGGLVELDLGPAIRNVLAEFNSSAFVDFLQLLTAIDEPLIPDPHYRGGGLHQILTGGYLNVHADFNRHPTLGLDRRVNVLVYLNRDWDQAWCGELELWDRSMSVAERRIAPLFNRTVIFSITDTAYHGHPEPLRCPADRTRRSLAFYYYSNGRPPAESGDAHSTLWRQPTDDDDRASASRRTLSK